MSRFAGVSGFSAAVGCSPGGVLSDGSPDDESRAFRSRGEPRGAVGGAAAVLDGVDSSKAVGGGFGVSRCGFAAGSCVGVGGLCWGGLVTGCCGGIVELPLLWRLSFWGFRVVEFGGGVGVASLGGVCSFGVG